MNTIGDSDFYDDEVHRHNVHFRAAAAVRAHDRVLDIGCGAGQSTREAARAAGGGSAVGVDASAAVLERARRLSREEGLGNVTFQLGDAQTHPFPPAHFDVCISRFGTMFFADPVVAFTNIRRALRPGARLVAMVWQDADRNEWFTATRQAIAGSSPPAASASDMEPFSLADRAGTQRMLAAAGFAGAAFADIHEPVLYGPDPAAACEAVLGLRHARNLLAGLDAPTAAHAVDRLRATLAAHDTGNGVYFDSRAWIVTARA
ncbi:MAG TPA: class I SAM-dependent methyltransferase [Acidimicrobiales bacterium]|nr:class I SAM-dependent methyltransferase [Acidimicrobiales bacterium]